MEMKKIKEKVSQFIRKYRYVAIILVIGIVLMCLPNIKNSTEEQASSETIAEEKVTLEESLCNILSQINGAGNVQVLLTVLRGEETVFQTDQDTSTSGESNTIRIETVIVSGQDRSQSGLIKQVNPPSYMGAVVVCEGADSPSVRLSIVDAVSKITGLGADRISVLKMK